ncbi:MAG: hypothetical protein U0936_22500 [Planctomycetaceae bacterium]
MKILLLNNQHLGMVVQSGRLSVMSIDVLTAYLGPVDHPEALGK